MPLPSSGPISMAQVRAELGGSGPISLGTSNVRSLAGLGSGAISLASLRGKSAAVGLGSFSLAAANNQPDGNTLNTGQYSGAYGSVSPSSVMGYAITSSRITRLLSNGTYTYSLHLQLNGAGSTQTAAVRGISIGGITIAGYITRDTDLKGNLVNTCSFKPTNSTGWLGGVQLSAAQWQAIYDGIVNKTTTVILV